MQRLITRAGGGQFGIVARIRFMGNKLFIVGVTLEILALTIGVQPTVVGWGLIAYGTTLLCTGYLR